MDTPFFSIVIPTYNHERYITGCIQSILAQSFTDWEVIVVNNYSEDNTIEVVKGFNDPRIQIVNIHNEGIIAKSRNEGIRRAKGEWICLLDSDDAWLPYKLERVYQSISKEQPDVVCHKMQLVNGANEVLLQMECGVNTDNLYKELLLNGNRVQNSSVCVNRSFLETNNLQISESPDFTGVEDYDFMMQLALRDAKFVFLNETLGNYLVNGNNFSMSDKFFSHLENLMRYHTFTLNKHNEDPVKLWNYISARISLKKGNSSIHKKKYLVGLIYWLKAVFKSPKAVWFYFKNRVSLYHNQ